MSSMFGDTSRACDDDQSENFDWPSNDIRSSERFLWLKVVLSPRDPESFRFKI
ncbi:19446_t:CDS:2, partial [Rhizophagus irregularis]